ncbi:hypothetical protein V8F33_012809 [Rhypophila sp. PSN 637]
MDPLSIAAAAAGFLATLESITKKLRDVSRKLRDSTTVKATLELGQQLIQLEFVTRSLLDREIPTLGGSSNTSAINVVQQIELNIQSCRADLDEVSELLDQLDNSLKEKARWVFKNHGKVMDLCESLNRHYNSLDLSLSTILILTTHQTRLVADRTLQETDCIKDQVHITREVAQDVKGDTTRLKRSVEHVGQSVDQMGFDVSEMLTLLRKFDQHKSWPFRGHGGFITTDLCFTLERYFRDQSGIDTEELRSQFSGFQTEDDLASLHSGWTWGGSKQGVPDNLSTSRPRYVRSQSHDSGPGPSPSPRQSAVGSSSRMHSSQSHIPSQSFRGVGTGMAESPNDESASKSISGETANGVFQLDRHRLSMRIDQSDDDLPPGMEDPDVPDLEQSDSDADLNEGSVSTRSVLDSQSQITTPSIPELPTKSITYHPSVSVQDQGKVTANDTPAFVKLKESLQALWDELASDETCNLIQPLRSELAIQQAQNVRKRLPSRLAQRRLYQELHQASGTSQPSLEHIKGLLEQGVSPNLPPGQVARFRQFHNTRTAYAPPLFLAIKNRNIPALRCLLQHGAEPDCHLVEETPLEKLLAEAKSDPSGSRTIITMALILASNGAKIDSSILSRAISLDGVVEDSTFLVIKLLLESGPNALRKLDLQADLLAKAEASRLDELLVEAVLQPGLQPSCANICSAVKLGSPKILSLLLNNLSCPVSLPSCLEMALNCRDEMAIDLLIARGLQPNCSNICLAISLGNPKIVRILMDSIPRPHSLPVCMEKAFSCWNEMAIELLMERGTSPPLEAIYRAIELRKPELFAKFVDLYCNEGSRPLNLQRCLSKAISYWNDHDSTIVQRIISRGAKPTEEQMTTIIEHDDLETIDILLALGTDISDFRFSCASADLACKILRSAAKSKIRVETKHEKLLVALSAILRPSGITKQGASQSESLTSEDSYAVHSINLSESHWSKQSTLALVRLLMQEKVCPDGEILLDVFTSQSLDTELALVVLSEIEEISHDVCLDIVQHGETDRVEFLLLNAGVTVVDISFLLEAALETSSYWQGKHPSFQYKHIPSLNGASMSSPYEEANDEIREKMKERIEEMSLVIFNYWLRAAPTPLRQRGLEFLVERMPGETQRQVISRCKYHPTLSTLQLLLQYSAVADSLLLLGQALTACMGVLDNEALREGELASWSELLVICLGLEFSVSSSEAIELKYQCLELILCHMEEKEFDINDSFAVDLRSPFNIIFTHCPPEELPRAIELFCKYGADANRPPVDERSDLPLIVAAEQAHGKAIPIMVEFGGDLLKALHFAMADGNIRAMRGGLLEESINMGILSKNAGFFRTTSRRLEPDVNVMDLFGMAIDTNNLDILDTLFDSGLEYSIDRDLDFLGSVAEFYSNNLTLPEWALPSYDLDHFCTWWAGPPTRTPFLGHDRPTDLYLNRSLISKMINQNLIRESGAILSCLLKRGSHGMVKPHWHPSTECLLFRAFDNPDIFLQLVDLKIPLRAKTWRTLGVDFKRYLREYRIWALTDSQLADGCLQEYVHPSGSREVEESAVMALFLDSATQADRDLTSMSFLDKIFFDYPVAEDRIRVLSSLFRAIGRLNPETLPGFQFCALAYSHERTFSNLALHPASQVAAAAVKAKINTSQAALVYAADSHNWGLVRRIIPELSLRDHKLSQSLHFGNHMPPSQEDTCRQLKRRAYFCQCTQMHKCNEEVIASQYRGYSVLFHAVQDGVVDIVELTMNRGPFVNGTYGDDNVLSRGSTVTLLHLAVFCCVDGPIREDRFKILNLLLRNGAKIDTKARVPNRFLKASYRSTAMAGRTEPVDGENGDTTSLDVKDFAKAMDIPEERQDKGYLGLRRKSKGSSSTMGLRETILEILQGGQT